MISSLVSLIVPDLGSTLASFLYYPTHWLIQLADFFASLPGSSVAVGSISTEQILLIYGLIISTSMVRWWQRRWWFAGLIAIVLIIIPVWYSANDLLRITLLATDKEPVLVIQDKGQVTLINSGYEGTGGFTILPFLQQQGVNKIYWAVSSKFLANENDAWLEILESLPISNFYAYASQLENNIETQAIQEKLRKRQGTNLYHSVKL